MNLEELGIVHFLENEADVLDTVRIKENAEDFVVREVIEGIISSAGPLLNIEKFKEGQAATENLPESASKEERRVIYKKIAHFPFKKVRTVGEKLVAEDSMEDIWQCTLMKKNLNTQDAVSILAKRLMVPPTNIQFAGTKDRRAVTFQEISVKCDFKRLFNLAYSLSENTELLDSRYIADKEAIVEANEVVLRTISEYMATEKEDLQDRYMLGNIRKGASMKMGVLDGNYFEIKVQEKVGVTSARAFINYYGPQRFGMHQNNHVIGDLILRKEYDAALDLIMSGLNCEERLPRKEYYIKVSREKGIPSETICKKMDRLSMMMYMHAVQSFEFNRAVNERIEAGRFFPGDKVLVNEQFCDPEPETSLDKIYVPLKRYNSKFLKGGYRKMIENIHDFSFEHTEGGTAVRFFLPKSSYATVALREIFRARNIARS